MVATAQTAGTAALAVAVVVKLTRVLMLAPMTAIAAVVARRHPAERLTGARPPIVPLFIVGFVALVLVRTFVPVPDVVLAGADIVQSALLATALFAIGAGSKIDWLVRTGGHALGAAAISWALILALGAGVAWVVAG